MAKSVIKWAGGKGKLLSTLRKFYPPELGMTIKKYCEPMVGGGAVMFDVLNNFNIEEIYICDINTELINLYSVIKNKSYELINVLSDFENSHIIKSEEEQKDYYISQRSRFNREIGNPTDENSILRAGMFIYLNKTCFNGLYRVNKNGFFNVPMGKYKKPLICDKDSIKNASILLSNVNIICGDYSSTYKYIDDKTFVYFDPPYRPISSTSSFTAYSSKAFDDSEQIRLFDFIKKINYAKIMISNSDPKNSNESDSFFDELYSDFIINRILASRSINSKGDARGKIKELLITNYEV